MNILITGHRLHKLENYDKSWIQESILDLIIKLKDKYGFIRGYSGMAGGVDLWFCKFCADLDIRYVACIPFEEQNKTMGEDEEKDRKLLISGASEILNVRNSYMIELCDIAIVVFDGNKGGTHNVFQQLIEQKMDFYWINPVAKCVWECIVPSYSETLLQEILSQK